MKHCFHKLEINFTDEEIKDLFEACDINEVKGIKFNEFIVLLCLVYLLKEDPTAQHAVSRTLSLLVYFFFHKLMLHLNALLIFYACVCSHLYMSHLYLYMTKQLEN